MNEKKKTKPGYMSTEFYLALVAAVAGVCLSTGVFTPEQCGENWCGAALQGVALVASILAALGYTAYRSKVKATDSIVSGVPENGDEPDPS